MYHHDIINSWYSHLYVLLLLVHCPLDCCLDSVLVHVGRLEALLVLLPRPDGINLALSNEGVDSSNQISRIIIVCMHFNYLVKEVLCKVLVQLKLISHCSEEGYHPVKSNHCFKLYDQIIKLRGNEIPINHGLTLKCTIPCRRPWWPSLGRRRDCTAARASSWGSFDPQPDSE